MTPAPLLPHPPQVLLATLERAQGSTGVHTHARTLLAGLRQEGVACELVNPFSRTLAWEPVFALRRVPLDYLSRDWGTRWYRYWHFMALRQALRTTLRSDRGSQVAAIVAQCPTSARAALDVRAETGRSFRIVLVAHFNYSEAAEYRAKGELSDPHAFAEILRLEDQILESVDEVVYVSAWAREAVEQQRGLRPRAGRVIHNGLPEQVALPPVTRAAIGCRNDDLILLNVGTLEPRKNQLGLVEAFAPLAQRCSRAVLVLVGDGPDRPAIVRRLAALQLEDRVKLLGYRRDVPAILPAADIYIHYADLENCPVSLLEAARAGLPIAAIPTGGIPELLEHLGGLALPSHDSLADLAAIGPWLEDSARRRAAGQLAQERFRRHFSQRAMIAAYIDALQVHPAPLAEAAP